MVRYKLDTGNRQFVKFGKPTENTSGAGIPGTLVDRAEAVRDMTVSRGEIRAGKPQGLLGVGLVSCGGFSKCGSLEVGFPKCVQ